MKRCNIKRFLDIVFSVLGLLVFLPFGLIIMFILKFSGEKEVFYLQPRVGKDGKIFNMIKFATMLKNSPNIGTGDITLKHDPRVLPFGKLLRKAKMNEVPQLLNILRGDMSFVGPRPHTPRTFSYYTEGVRERIGSIKPGLTGISSVIFRDEESVLSESSKAYIECYTEDIIPRKAVLEMWYLENQSIALDIKIIVLTAWVVLFPSSKVYRIFLKGIPIT